MQISQQDPSNVMSTVLEGEEIEEVRRTDNYRETGVSPSNAGVSGIRPVKAPTGSAERQSFGVVFSQTAVPENTHFTID